MSIEGLWLASASKRRATLLNDLISIKKPEIKLACIALVEEEKTPTCFNLQETVSSIAKMKMNNAKFHYSEIAYWSKNCSTNYRYDPSIFQKNHGMINRYS